MSAFAEASVWEQPMAPDEFERLVARALQDLDGPEGQEMTAFMAWFKRRYPTPLERLRFTTRHYKQSIRRRGVLRPR